MENNNQMERDLLHPHRLVSMQNSWEQKSLTNLKEVFKLLKKLKAKPALKSFLIKFFNNSIFLPDICHCRFSHDENIDSFHLIICESLNTLVSLQQRKNWFKKPNSITISYFLFAFYKALLKKYFENEEVDIMQVKETAHKEIRRHEQNFLKA